MEISDVLGDNFTLIARWTKTSPAVAVSGLAAEIDYVAKVTPPTGGFRAPLEGKISLSGGADAVAVDAVKSSATAPAK